jgi:hypothetical protein
MVGPHTTDPSKRTTFETPAADDIMDNKFLQAANILGVYYRALVDRLADEIIENREDFEASYPGTAEEIVDRYGLRLFHLGQLQMHLMQHGGQSGMPGLPVQPSGIAVGPETRLEAGSPVLIDWHGRWFRGEVVAIESGNQVRVHYVGWDARWDETVPRSRLQLDNAGSSQDA